jgi:hypothetical protein
VVLAWILELVDAPFWDKGRGDWARSLVLGRGGCFWNGRGQKMHHVGLYGEVSLVIPEGVEIAALFFGKEKHYTLRIE